jgi:hypothetical protein
MRHLSIDRDDHHCVGRQCHANHSPGATGLPHLTHGHHAERHHVAHNDQRTADRRSHPTHRQLTDAAPILGGLPIQPNLHAARSAHPRSVERHPTAPTGLLQENLHPSAHLDPIDRQPRRYETEPTTTYYRCQTGDHEMHRERVLRSDLRIHLALLDSSIGRCVAVGLDWTSLEG